MENWNEDTELSNKIKKYVEQGLKRREMLDFLKKEFPFYPWSIRTLDRRMRYFGIYYMDQNLTLDDIKQAVKTELDGPGKLLGYRAMQKKVRQVWNLRVPRDMVYDIMYFYDPEGLKNRIPGAKKKAKKGQFISPGPNMVHSIDGHDKLMGYQNNTYPLAIYGCIDSASRKLLWIKAWTSNSDPELPAKWYLSYIKKTHHIASMLRLDKGTETGILATMHSFLRRNHGDMDPSCTVMFGPSTSNQVSNL